MANWMLGKAPWEPVTTQNLQYAQTRDANGHLSGGWVSKRKGTWKKNPRTEMRELINANGQHYKVPVLDASDFLDARALGTFDNMIDRSATDEQALLAFIKDSEGKAVEQNGTGHILKLAYSLANQTLLVTFNNEKHGSDIVAYFRVPVEVWSELQVLAQNTDAGQYDDVVTLGIYLEFVSGILYVFVGQYQAASLPLLILMISLSHIARLLKVLKTQALQMLKSSKRFLVLHKKSRCITTCLLCQDITNILLILCLWLETKVLRTI